jgi:hypothetical protein
MRRMVSQKGILGTPVAVRPWVEVVVADMAMCWLVVYLGGDKDGVSGFTTLYCCVFQREGDSPSSYAPSDDATIDAQGPLQHGAKSAGLKGSCLCRGRDPQLTGAVIGVLQAMPRF